MSISTISGSTAFARARIGSNGDTSDSAAECFTGASATNLASGRKIWCANTSAGFDSGWVSVVWIMTTAGGSGSIQFQVGGGSPSTVSFAGPACDGIDSITIRAAVSGANRRASFRSIVVDFFDEPTDTAFAERRTIPDGQAPIASTMGQTDPAEADVPKVIQPDGFDYGKVRFSADIRFECTDAGLPSEDALFADMYAFT